MPTMPSTVRAIDALKPAAKTVVYSGGDGFALIVTPKNARSLVQRYRPVPGQNPVTVTICAFDADMPKRLTLAEARAEGHRIVREKILPTLRDKVAAAPAAAAPAALTFDAVCEAYITRQAGSDLRERTLANIGYNLVRARQKFGARAMASITPEELNQFLELEVLPRGERFGGPAALNAIRATLRAMLKWARKLYGKAVVQVVPDDFVDAQKRQVRSNLLSDAQIRALLTADLSPELAGIARLQLLAGFRAVEVAELRWSEVEATEIVIPGERMKEGKEHRLPITPAIRAILDAARARQHGTEPAVFARSHGTYKNAVSGLELGFSSHDIRRTFRSRLGEMEVPYDVAEELVAHAVHTGTQASYNHYRAKPAAKAKALNDWAAVVARIEAGEDNVVTLAA